MLAKISDFHEKSINFSSRHPLREISVTNPSSEVYYGRAGASIGVPFMWESQPGTPKVRHHENPLPPLTPPPSFHFSPIRKPNRRPSKSKLFHTVLPKFNLRKTSHLPSPASSSSSSQSSSCSMPSSPFTPSNIHGQFHFSSTISSFDLGIHEEAKDGSPVSALCFGTGRGANARFRGCSSNIIKVLLRKFA